jgi:hypothetical protein
MSIRRPPQAILASSASMDDPPVAPSRDSCDSKVRAVAKRRIARIVKPTPIAARR